MINHNQNNSNHKTVALIKFQLSLMLYKILNDDIMLQETKQILLLLFFHAHNKNFED